MFVGFRSPSSSGRVEDAENWEVLHPELNNEQFFSKIILKNSILDHLLDILTGIENSKSNFNTPKITEFEDFKIRIKIQKETDKQKSQFAYLICKEKNSHLKDCSIKGPFKPVFKKKHSEDYVIQILKQMIQTGEIRNYSEIWIYTTNNPCIMRKKHTPCMCKLINLSVELGRNHKIKTYIGFSQFYILSTNMGNIFKECKEFDSFSNKIIKASNHLAPDLKFSVKFDQSDFNYEFKKIMKEIPKDKKKKVYENKIEIPQSLNLLEQTSIEWRQTIRETAKELVNEMQEKIGDEFYDRLESVIINWCNKEVNKVKLLKEEFLEALKEQVVLHYLEQSRDLEHYPVFFRTDLNQLPLDEE